MDPLGHRCGHQSIPRITHTGHSGVRDQEYPLTLAQCLDEFWEPLLLNRVVVRDEASGDADAEVVNESTRSSRIFRSDDICGGQFCPKSRRRISYITNWCRRQHKHATFIARHKSVACHERMLVA